MSVCGARASEQEFQSLPIPDRIWGDVDDAMPLDVFVKQSVGDRLFIESIVDERSVASTFLDGFKVQQVVDAALASGECGARVSIVEVG